MPETSAATSATTAAAIATDKNYNFQLKDISHIPMRLMGNGKNKSIVTFINPISNAF